MAITQKFVLNNLHRTIIKFVSDGTTAPTQTTVTLPSLVHTSSGFPQTVSGTPKVAIIGASVSLIDNSNPVTIKRNNETTLKLFGQYTLPQDTIGQIKLDENSTSDIVITFTGDGTLFLDLRKDDGYTFGPNVNIA